MLKRIAGLAMVALTLCSCATAGKYEAKMRALKGHSEKELVSIWGPPDGVYELDGARYLTYSKSGSFYIPGQSPTYTTTFFGNTASTNAYGGRAPMMISMNCSTTFTIEGGVVNHVRWEGNACKSK